MVVVVVVVVVDAVVFYEKKIYKLVELNNNECDFCHLFLVFQLQILLAPYRFTLNMLQIKA